MCMHAWCNVMAGLASRFTMIPRASLSLSQVVHSLFSCLFVCLFDSVSVSGFITLLSTRLYSSVSKYRIVPFTLLEHLFLYLYLYSSLNLDRIYIQTKKKTTKK
ncbi:uncharacterized protein BDW47DRAFT_5874 [Aspergillus candidus]|uniref:Uncharacterized protein n=1 Tax=Aspergillus candidus TaxID=41067 RepID=A0A2I2FHK1_ASPCN|nr:hypothetical protein BDW47DRAFT_5874 [Aspergillus candidus]PLB40102.1 hypothetical protein BDW47DRAFT_5874 [Aspergillus candidus]